jgi:NAD(P)-dependent dehydrogenase (short-subunit alcohol dehydrogenase family)
MAYHAIKVVHRDQCRQSGFYLLVIISKCPVDNNTFPFKCHFRSKGNLGQANYSASKAGLIGLTKSAAKELAPRGITVNAVAPGFIETEMTQKLSEQVKETYQKVIPLNYFGAPRDVANTVLFLASEDARYITGEVIRVDGGMRM